MVLRWMVLLAAVTALLGSGEARAQGLEVAVLRFRAPPEQEGLAAQLLQDVVTRLQASGVFARVVGPEEQDARLGSSAVAQLRETALDKSALVDLDLAGGLGVSHMLVGSVTAEVDRWALDLTLVELRSGRELAVAHLEARAGPELSAQLGDGLEGLLQRAALKTATAQPVRSPGTRRPPRWLVGVLSGVGVLALGTGAVVGLLAEGAVLTTYYLYAVPTPTRNYAQRVAFLNGVAGAGVAALGLGVLLALGSGAAGVAVAATGGGP